MALNGEKGRKKIENVKSGSQKCKKKNNMYMVLVTKCHNYTKTRTLIMFLMKQTVLIDTMINRNRIN